MFGGINGRWPNIQRNGGNYEEVFNKEFVEGTEIVFSGKVYKMDETLVEIDPVFP